jgi:hypothetical protein
MRPPPPKKVWGRDDDQVVEDSAKLRIDSLGKPSEIILLRDADAPHKRKVAWRSGMRQKESNQLTKSNKLKKEDASHQEIVNIVEAEDKDLNQEQINASIDSTRRGHSSFAGTPELVSKPQYDRTFELLYNGYSLHQLAAYSETFPEETPKSSTVHDAKQSVLLYRGLWKPLISQHSDGSEMEESDDHELKDQSTKKGKLVDNIMRNQWRMRIQEIEEGRGELIIHMRPWQLALLNLHSLLLHRHYRC